jgi:hypothetical protein
MSPPGRYVPPWLMARPGDRRATDHAHPNGERRGPMPQEASFTGEVPFAVNMEIPIFTARPPHAGHASSFFSSVNRLYDSYC